MVLEAMKYGAKDYILKLSIEPQKILDVQITWKICDDGRISSTMEAVKDCEFPRCV